MSNRLFRFLTVWNRARKVSKEAKLYFDGVVHNCSRVSRANHALAFAVHKVGIFGGPVIEQIRRPDCITLTEKSNCVIIKDGDIYELKKNEL